MDQFWNINYVFLAWERQWKTLSQVFLLPFFPNLITTDTDKIVEVLSETSETLKGDKQKMVGITFVVQSHCDLT